MARYGDAHIELEPLTRREGVIGAPAPLAGDVDCGGAMRSAARTEARALVNER